MPSPRPRLERFAGNLWLRLSGDREAALRQVSLARALLGRLQSCMGDASTAMRRWTFPGVNIRTIIADGIHIAEIEAVAGAPEVFPLHGIICEPIYDGTFPGEQFFQPCRQDENWVPFRKVRRDTHYEGGDLDWSSLDRKYRLTFEGPIGGRLMPPVYDANESTSTSLWLYNAAGPSTKFIAPRLILGAAVRVVDDDGVLRKFLLISTRKTIYPDPGFGHWYGITEVEFYRRELKNGSAWVSLGTETYADDHRLVTMTMFNRAGTKCAGVNNLGHVLEWSFDVTGSGESLSFSVTRELIDDSPFANTYTEEGVWGDHDFDVGSGDWIGYKQSYTGASTFLAYRNICADYRDEELLWLREKLENTIDITVSSVTVTVSSSSASRTLEWSDEVEVDSVSYTSSSTTDINEASQSGSGTHSAVEAYFVFWADPRSRSVLYDIVHTSAYSFEHVNGTVPSYTITYTADVTFTLRLIHASNVVDIDEVEITHEFNGSGNYPNTSTFHNDHDAEGEPYSFSNSNDGGGFGWGPWSAFGPFIISCCPIQVAEGEELFMSVSKEHWYEGGIYDPPAPEDREWFNYLFLDGESHDAVEVFGLEGHADVHFAPMGSF